MRASVPALALFAAVGVVALTGCSGGDQSVADACTIAQTTMAEAQTEISGSLAGAGAGDYSTMTEAMKKLGAKFAEAEGKVSNAEVKGALKEFQTGIDEFTKVYSGATDGDVSALEGKMNELQAASGKLEQASTKIQELCTP